NIRAIGATAKAPRPKQIIGSEEISPAIVGVIDNCAWIVGKTLARDVIGARIDRPRITIAANARVGRKPCLSGPKGRACVVCSLIKIEPILQGSCRFPHWSRTSCRNHSRPFVSGVARWWLVKARRRASRGRGPRGGPRLCFL